MKFTELLNEYDFTESEITRMEWRIPFVYTIHFNYYWGASGKPSQTEQPMVLVLQDCIRFYLRSNLPVDHRKPLTFGTVVGWGAVSTSPDLPVIKENFSDTIWTHLFFQIGSTGRIEAVCQRFDLEF